MLEKKNENITYMIQSCITGMFSNESFSNNLYCVW